MKTFGPSFSRALCRGSATLSALGSPVPIEWILAIIALESAGTWDPNVLQARARLVAPFPDRLATNAKGEQETIRDMRPEVSGSNGLRLSHGTGARGLFQVMPSVVRREGKPNLLILYGVNDPTLQLFDGIARFVNIAKTFRTGGYKSRVAFYCANLAPARLLDGKYNDETILYSNHPDDRGLPNRVFWPDAYERNAKPFGLDPHDPTGRIRMRDLEVGLIGAVRASQSRIDAELAAAYAVNAGGGGDDGPAAA